MRLRRKKADPVPGAMHAQIAPGARQMVRNLVLTRDGTVWAGYRMGPARWDYLGDDAKALVLDQVADVWATLLGRDVHERVTSRPYPVSGWAQALDERTPNPPDEAGWTEHLVRMQHRVLAAGMDDHITYRYVTVGSVDPDTDLIAEATGLWLENREPSPEVREVLLDERRVADAVTGPGWRAVRMTERDAGWLRARSLAPGVAAPFGVVDGGWTAAEMIAFENDVRWSETPFDRTVKITAWRDGIEHERYAQVLTLVRAGDQDYPDNGLEPWQTFTDRAFDAEGVPFGVEWNIVGRLATGEELSGRAELDYLKAKNISETYRVHQEDPPQYVGRGIAVANEARDLISTGTARDSGRFVGTVNAMVTGATPEQAEQRADALRRLYGGTALRMEFSAPHAQAAKAREFVPGEPVDRHGYQRQIRLDYLATGLPNVSAAVGDDRGPYIGYTRGASRRPVMHDPHYNTEGRGELGRQQNLWVVAGTLGSGKSVLMGAIAYDAAKRGIKVVARDPSGPLGRLCDLEDIKPWSRSINLLEAPAGALSPPQLVRTPTRGEFADDMLYEQARAAAAGERRALTIDIARRCLDWDLFSDPATLMALRAAADVAGEKTGWTERASIWDLVDALDGGPVATALRAAAEMPVLALLFPEPGREATWATMDAPILTVVATPGIRRAPDAAPREDWSPQELAADPVLRMAARFSDRLLFDKPMGDRAVFIADEAEDMTDTGAGRALLSRLGRDHSKWNIGVYLGLKNVTDQMMGTELRNFVAGAFVGRQAARGPAVEMLRVLNVEDHRYASDLMVLSDTQPGEFVHLDANGRVGSLKVDVDYHPPLRDALLTNPAPEGSGAWNPAEETMA